MNETVYVAGYPQKPGDIYYSAPILRNKDPANYEDKIKEAFLNFNYKMYSEGTLIEQKDTENDALVCNYSSTSGQSGGPVYVRRNEVYQLIGVNIGGASISYQREIGEVIGMIRKDNWDLDDDLFTKVIQSMKSTQEFELAE